jgi:dTDP-4-amino-4,6-dideoxygalactose transaminase
MHKQPVYLRGKKEEVRCKNYSVVTSESSVAYVNGVSEEIFKIGMCLPAGPYVSDDDVKYIVETIKSAII